MTDKKTPRNETMIYVSPEHKARLKTYTATKTKRTMRAETEMWIDSLETN